MSAPVSVRTIFERFPASVRGAVGIRGADTDPHQVTLSSAAVVELRAPARAVREVAVQPVTVDLAPRREVLVPFEVPVAGLDPGWYGVTAEVLVDGAWTVRGPDQLTRRFLVPWPRGAVRRGTIDAGVTIEAPGQPVRVDRVECRPDRAVVRWHEGPGDEEAEIPGSDLAVVADGRALPVLETTGDPAAGTRSTVVYPVLAVHRELVFELRRRARPGERGPWSATLPLS